MRNKAIFAVAASLLTLVGFSATGCSDRTEQAASNTVEGAAQDARNHTEAAGQAVEKTGEAVGSAAEQAGENVAAAGREVATETKQAAKGAAQYTKEAAAGAAKDVEDIGQVATLTPAIKDALIRSKVDASGVDVDTSGEKDTVILKGTVPTAAQKTQAAQVAMKTIKDGGHSFKVKNELTVAK